MTPRPLDRSGREPLWSQVLDDLRVRLAAGDFADGLPAERELQSHYAVSRHTMREALRRLHEAGAIERTRGRGSFPRRHPIEQRTGTLYSLFRAIEAQGIVQRSAVLTLRRTTDRTAAAALGVAASTKLIELRRVRYADDEPIAVDELWIPAAIGAALLDVDFTHTAVYDELVSRCGVYPGAGWERIHPVVATAEQCELLGIAAPTAIFLVERWTGSNDRPLEWRRTFIRGDRFAFVSTWMATGEPGEAPAFQARSTSRA